MINLTLKVLGLSVGSRQQGTGTGNKTKELLAYSTYRYECTRERSGHCATKFGMFNTADV